MQPFIGLVDLSSAALHSTAVAVPMEQGSVFQFGSTAFTVWNDVVNFRLVPNDRRATATEAAEVLSRQ